MKVPSIFNDLNMGHGRFEIEHVIAPSGCTTYGIYAQCLRELYVRYQAIVASIEAARSTDHCDEVRLTIKHQYREFVRFASIAVHLKKLLGPLTPETIDELEFQTSVEQLKRRAAVQVALTGNLSPELMDAILNLPKRLRVEILAFVKNPELTFQYVIDFEPPVDLSQIPNLTQTQLLEFVSDKYIATAGRILDQPVYSISGLLEDYKD